jgi:DNA-binding MarR family transcriptional regulator
MDMTILNGFVGYALRRAQAVVFSDLSEALSELKLRPVQYTVLILIDQNPGTSQSCVSTALGIQKANFVAVIASLVARGLVRRQRSKLDGRTYSLGLTPAGKALLSQAGRLQSAHESRLVAHLGAAGRSRLLKLLDHLTHLPGGAVMVMK